MVRPSQERFFQFLARLEAQEAFPALLARFPDLAIAGQPVSRSGIALHGHASLPVSAR